MVIQDHGGIHAAMLLTISTIGHAIASLADIAEALLTEFIRPILIGADPMRHELHWRAMYKWQHGRGMRLTDRVLCAVELALRDFIGKAMGQPMWKLLRGNGNKLLAYGSCSRIGLNGRLQLVLRDVVKGRVIEIVEL